MAKKTDFTPLTRKRLEDAGYAVWNSQVWNSFAHKYSDMFGCIDLLAFRDGAEPDRLGIQETDHSHAAARVNKAMAAPLLKKFLGSGCRFEVWAYKKVDGTWSVQKREVRLEGGELVTDKIERKKRERKLFR